MKIVKRCTDVDLQEIKYQLCGELIYASPGESIFIGDVCYFDEDDKLYRLTITKAKNREPYYIALATGDLGCVDIPISGPYG